MTRMMRVWCLTGGSTGFGRALDRGARRTRRRRAKPSGGRQELRLARPQLRRPLLGGEDRRRHVEAGHGAAGLLLGPGDRALRHGLLHGRGVSRVAGQPPHQLAAAGAPGPADTRGRAGHPRRREERYLADLDERIRDVRQGPYGLPYLLADSRDGRILRVLPAAPR